MEKIKISNSIFAYYPDKVLGSGSFCKVYLGINTINNKLVAVKIEEKEENNNTLVSEFNFYSEISKHKRYYDYGIPKFYGFFNDDKKYYIVMELLKYSLIKIMEKIKQNFDDYSTKNIFIKMIKSIKFIHECNFIHRDIKPENIIIDNKFKKIILIDYGLSKKYIRNNDHIKLRINVSPCGTIRYMSKWVNCCIESSRRDDLISLGYTMLFIFKGSLPWQGISVKNKKEKYKKIAEMKTNMSVDDLCKNTPIYFKKYFEYCYQLKFKEDPDYNLILSFFS